MLKLQTSVRGCLFLLLSFLLLAGAVAGEEARKPIKFEGTVPIEPLSEEKSTCDWIDYACYPGSGYSWPQPDAYGDLYFNMRFTVPQPGACSLKTIAFMFDPDNSSMNVAPIMVSIWDSDNGLPNSSIHLLFIPLSDIQYYPSWTVVTLDPPLLVNESEIHIDYSTNSYEDTLAILSDDGSCGTLRSSEYWRDGGGWGTMLDDWGIDVNFYILAEFCCAEASGDNCTDPIVVEAGTQLPYVSNNTTCGKLNDYSSSCLSAWDNGEDIIYQINVPTQMTLDFQLDPQGTTWTGMVLDDACPPGQTNCIAQSTLYTGDPHGFTETLEAGTYYLMVDTYPQPACIPDFELTISEGPPNQLPYITNVPTLIERSYAHDIYYDFFGVDPEGDPIAFSKISGPGTLDPNTGEWTVDASAFPMAYNLEIQICDDFDCVAYSIPVIIENLEPIYLGSYGIDNIIEGVAGKTIVYPIQSDFIAPEIGETLLFSKNTGPGTIDINGNFIWNSTPEDAGTTYLIGQIQSEIGYIFFYDIILSQEAVCGDANGDGSVNLADAGFIVNYIFYGGPAPEPFLAGDANGDGSVNLADAGFIVNYIFYTGPEPCAVEGPCCTGPACNPNPAVAVTYNEIASTTANCGGGFGLFEAWGPLQGTYTACCLDGDNWQIRVSTLTSRYSISVCAQGRTNVNAAGDVADLATCQAVVADLTFVGAPAPGRAAKATYTSTDCTQIHEDTHLSEWQTVMDAAFAAAEPLIEALVEPCVVGGVDTPAKAVAAQMANITPLVAASITAAVANATGHGPPDTSDAYTDQKACHDALIAALKAAFPGC